MAWVPSAWACALAVAMVLAPGAGMAAQSDWHQGFNSKARLHVAKVEAGAAPGTYAFIEIVMPKGWKTYWRNPGDAGGLPPRFEWTRSENLASASVLYPAPRRLTDEAGDNIGYKESVIFPVRLAVVDAGRPVKLALDLSYGICKDICVPAEAALEVELAPAGAMAAGDDLVEALSAVPRAVSEPPANGPVLKGARILEQGGPAKLIVEASFPGGAEEADVFIEAPDGLYVPMLAKTGPSPSGGVVFSAALGNALEPKELSGKTLKATLVSAAGSAEVEFRLP